MNTIKEAKDWLAKQAVNGGAPCPCCNQLVKLYRRRITGEMAYGLILMRKADQRTPGQFIHLPTFLADHKAGKSNMTSLLRHWELIEQQPGERDDGSWRTGYYRTTSLGCQFVDGHSSIPKYAFLYNQMLLRLSQERVTITEALGSKFDYAQLMAT
jgi:hypothetical protein